MAKDPAFLFYSNDFTSGTQFFTNEEVGIYIRLMCAQHQHGRLSEKQVKIICNSLESDVMQKFTKDENGLYYNERLEFEIEKRRNYSASRSGNRKGKTKTTEKQTVKKNISISYDKHMENENENRNIIEYLNKKCSAKFKTDNKKTHTLINSRRKEGFTQENFISVIDKKCKEWSTDTKMCLYLRPETLFGNKFEGYLNQKEINQSKTPHFQNGINIDEIDYSNNGNK